MVKSRKHPKPEGGPYKSDAARLYFLRSALITEFTGSLMYSCGAHSKAQADYIQSNGKYGVEPQTDPPIPWSETLSAFIFSTLVARVVDNFLTYLADVLNVVFHCEPNLLRTLEEPVKIEQILQYDTIDELLASIAEKRIESLSHQSMGNLAEFFSGRLKVEVFPDKDDLRSAMLFNDLRNLIVHNRGVVTKRLATKYPEQNFMPGAELALDRDVVTAAQKLFRYAVLRTDIAASERFGFPPPTLVIDPARLTET